MEKEKESGGDKKKDSQQAAVNTFTLFLTHVGPATEEIAKQQFIRMPTSVDDDPNAKTALLIPGIEGYATVLDPLVANLKMKAVSLQYAFDGNAQSIQTLAENLLSVSLKMLYFSLNIGGVTEINIYITFILSLVEMLRLTI